MCQPHHNPVNEIVIQNAIQIIQKLRGKIVEKFYFIQILRAKRDKTKRGKIS